MSVAVNPATDTVYFADAANAVSVIDGSNNTVTATIALPTAPQGVAVDPVTDTVYVSLASTTTSSPAVAVIDGATNTVKDTITLPASSTPFGIAVNSSTDTVYVAEESAAAVAVIDGSTNTVTTTVSTGSGTRPGRLAVDESSNVVWVAAGSGVVAISGSANTVTQTISFSAVVGSVAVNPASDTVYAAIGATGVAVIDGAAGTVTTTVSIPVRVFGLGVDPGSGTVFASSPTGSSGSGTTWVIDATSNAIVDTLARGGLQLAVNTSTGLAYVAPYSAQTNAVWVLTPSAANAVSPLVLGASSATFTVGSAGSATFTVRGLPTPTLTVTGALPAGVTLNQTGTMSGTPADGTGGVYPITITASNGIAPDYSLAVTLTVDEAPSISAPSSLTFTVGTAVTVPLKVTGFPAPQVAATSVPAGVSLVSPGQGQWQLTGTPQVGSGGLYNVGLSATNSVGGTSMTVPVTVLEAPSIPTNLNPIILVTGINNNFTISVNGFPADTLTVTGSLPPGMTLSQTGVLSGTPPVGSEGVYHFTVTATNSLGTATRAFTADVRQPVAIGVEGSDGQLWAQAPQLGPGWHPLGGTITAPPAVVAIDDPTSITPAAPMFIATGGDKHLWIRSLTAGWQSLGPATASCLGAPAAAITGTLPNGPFTLTVACRGTDNQLWFDTTTMPTTGLPTVTSAWTSLFGVPLSAGPAAAPVGFIMTFFINGTDGHLYTRTLNSTDTVMPWSCLGQPAAAQQALAVITTFACEGTDHALWEATADRSATWSPAVSLGGQLASGPAVAAGNEPYLLAEGADHAVWARTPDTGWVSLGGNVIGGVGAAALD